MDYLIDPEELITMGRCPIFSITTHFALGIADSRTLAPETCNTLSLSPHRMRVFVFTFSSSTSRGTKLFGSVDEICLKMT